MAGTRKEKKETQHIQAFARLRPFNSQELEFHAKRCVELHGKDIVVNMQHGTRQYSFDKVFDSNSKQKDVYVSVVNPLLAEVIQGYNCTIFAYGQTGSGKTYTMVGSPTPTSSSYLEDSHAGIIPRTLAHLFESLNKNSELDFTIRVSYLELYNEVLIDLLSSEDKSLKIYEDQKNKGSVQIYGLEEVTVFDKHQVYEILQRGTEKRQTAMTLMNSQSSRSHTVFTVTLHSRETTLEGEELVKTGKLNLVDLAGSENIQRSGAMDKRAREAGNINQSLLTLGRVIKALVEKSSHVPYRESKLTRILQDSLGGRTKTAIIATISPAANNMEESMSTLDYAHRSRNITNRPEVNQRMSKTALIQGYLEQIDRLKKDVLAARNQEGIYLNPDNYNLIVAESEKRKEDLLKAVAECATFETTVQELEHKKKELEQVYHVTKTELEGATGSLEKSKEDVKKLREERQIHQELIDKFEQAQTELIDDNRSLSNSLNRYLSEHHALRNKLDNLYNANDKNDNSARELQNNINMSCAFTSEKCQCFANSIKEKTQWVHNDMTEAMIIHEEHFKITSNIMQDLRTSFISTMQKTLSDIEALNMKQLQSTNDCIHEHQHTITKLVPCFTSYNKIIEDNFMKYTEKLDMCSTANAQIALNIKNTASETQKRLSGNIESITHDLDTLANMTKKNLDVVSKKFQNLSIDTDTAESDLDKAIEQLLASKSLMQKHKSKLADSCKVINELIEENYTHTAHAQTTCSSMQKVIDDSTTVICNDTAGMTEKMEQTISEMVKLKESDRNNQKEVVVLMDGVKISHEKTLEQLTAHVTYNEEEHGKIIKTYRNLINDHNNTSSSLQEKLDDHDKAIVTSSERVFTVLGDLEKDTTSNTHLISKDINVIKDTVDKYVDGLVVVKPSGDTPARSDEKNSYKTPKRVRSIRPILTIPNHDSSLEEVIEMVSSSEES